MTKSEQARVYKAEVDELQKTANFSKMGNLISPMSIRKARAVEMLAGGATATFICETLGIARSTLWEWRQEPEFKRQVEEQVGLTVPNLKRKLIQVLKRALLSIENQLIDGDDDGKLAMKMIASAQVWKQLKELEDDDIDQNRTSQDRDLSNIAERTSGGSESSRSSERDVHETADPNTLREQRNPESVEGSTPSRKEIDQNRARSNIVEHSPDSGHDSPDDSTSARLEYKSGHPERELNVVDQNRAQSDAVERFPGGSESSRSSERGVHETADLNTLQVRRNPESVEGSTPSRKEIDHNRTSQDRVSSNIVERFPGARESGSVISGESESRVTTRDNRSMQGDLKEAIPG
jgi:Helix-turn-helix of insertion element transposase